MIRQELEPMLILEKLSRAGEMLDWEVLKTDADVTLVLQCFTEPIYGVVVVLAIV